MPEKVTPAKVAEKAVELPAGTLTADEELAILKEGDAPAGYAKDDRPKSTEETATDALPTGTPDAKTITKEEPAKEEVHEETSLDRVERLLAQPEDKVSLKGIASAEQALYHQMRRDRKNRQRAETERDLAIKRSLELEAKLKAPPVVTSGDAFKDFDGRDDDEVISVKEVKERLGKITPPAAAPTPAPQVDPVWEGFLQMSEQVARKDHDDFDVVMELAQDILVENPKHLAELGDAVKSKKNPAEVAYTLIKNDPSFEALLPAARARHRAKQPAPETTPSVTIPDAPAPAPTPAASPKAEAADKALAQPPKATRTTANVSAGGEPPTDELTEEALLEMPDREFARLPKKQRDHYLKKFGGAPNSNV